jgi:hypothetical protein
MAWWWKESVILVQAGDHDEHGAVATVAMMWLGGKMYKVEMVMGVVMMQLC